MILRQTLPAVRTAHATQRTAFTLMEVLVVVAILVVLAGVGIPIYSRIQENAYKNAAKTIITKVEQAIEAYKLQHGQLPDNLQVLTQPEDGAAAFLETKSLLDPWNRPVVYEPSQTHPQSGRPMVYSQGPRPGDQTSRVTNW